MVEQTVRDLIRRAAEGIESLVTAGMGVFIEPLTAVYNGTDNVTTSASELASSQSVNSVTVKALSTNTANVYVGNASVTTSNGFELLPGESVSLDIDNLNKIYVITGTGTQVVRYIAI